METLFSAKVFKLVIFDSVNVPSTLLMLKKRAAPYKGCCRKKETGVNKLELVNVENLLKAWQGPLV